MDNAPKAAAEPVAINFQAVSKVYPVRGRAPSATALDDVSLQIPQGAIYGVIGRSGAGKSTLLRLVNGLEKPSFGSVIVNGVEVNALAAAELRALRRRAGMIFQHFNLLSSKTVFGNVALPLELGGTSRAAISDRVDELLDLVGLADKASRYPSELSGGQKQRVGIARALATRPDVLLSDEATSALDPETTASILALLAKVNAVTGVTIVLITHEMQVIKAICGHVAVMEHGRVIERGPVYDVFAHPQTATSKAFVSSVTGSALPENLRRNLSSDASRQRAVIRVIFTGDHATAPIVSRLSRTLDIDVNILAGQVDQIGDAPFGNLVIGVPSREDIRGAVLGFVKAHGFQGEVLGYVD